MNPQPTAHATAPAPWRKALLSIITLGVVLPLAGCIAGTTTREPEPSLPLDGTTWTLTGTLTGQERSALPAGIESTLKVRAGGTSMDVDTGCNSMGPTFEHGEGDTGTAGTLAIDDSTITMMACGPEATKVQGLVTSVIAGLVDYTIDGATLTLKNGERGLVYEGS